MSDKRLVRRFCCLLLGTIICTFDMAAAQDAPPLDVLRKIASQLPHHPVSRGTTFHAGSGAVDPVCGMQHFTMTLATGSAAARSVPVLLDRNPGDGSAPPTLFAMLHRVTVDADGSPRTYHPDDPHGTGTCSAASAPGGEMRQSGVCALDDFASAHLLVFRGGQKLGKGEFEAPWQGIWPLIRDKKLPPIELKRYVATAPDGFYLFYWKDRDLIALFKREIIPQATDGFPCRHDDGYFVAATTLKQDGVVLPDGCAPSRFMDAERIPFIVLPDDAFGNDRAGDIVVGRLAGAPADRVVYGVVGDTGPVAHFGEASVAFNRALLARSAPIVNGHDVDALDISGGPVIVTVFGGTKALLRGDYSLENIDRVGRAIFARWNGDAADPLRRLQACARDFEAK
jgi:hypothetical protein